MRSKLNLAMFLGWISVLFVESQTQLLSSVESLLCVECEHDSVLLLSPEVLHKSRVGSENPCWACGGDSVTPVLSPPVLYILYLFRLSAVR